MNSDLDDLLGDSPAPKRRGRPPKGSTPKKAQPAAAPKRRGSTPKKAQPAAAPKRRGRPPKAKIADMGTIRPIEDDEAEMLATLGETELPDVTYFHRPVTRTFLAQVLGKEPRRLIKQLKQCKPIAFGPAYGANGPTPLYDFKEALSYCIEPKIDIGEWIRTQQASDIPMQYHEAFWKGVRVKQIVMREAGDLWHTADVLEVLGRTAIEIKDTVRLWVEQMPGKDQMSTEQYESLMAQTTGLLDMIYDRLQRMPAERQTRPDRALIDAMFEGKSDIPLPPPADDDE